MDRSDPRPPDLCGHSCVRPLRCPQIPIFIFFRGSRPGPSSWLMLQSASSDPANAEDACDHSCASEGQQCGNDPGGGPQTYPNNLIFGFFNPVLNDFGRFRAIFQNSADFREISRIFPENPRLFRPISSILVGFGSSQEIPLKKNCQGMPSDPDLEP